MVGKWTPVRVNDLLKEKYGTGLEVYLRNENNRNIVMGVYTTQCGLTKKHAEGAFERLLEEAQGDIGRKDSGLFSKGRAGWHALPRNLR